MSDELKGTISEAETPSIAAKHLAYAEAAIVLLESVMMKLIEKRVVTKAEMIDAVDVATATKRQMAADGEHPQISSVAAGVLQTLANSLRAGPGGKVG